MSVESFVANVKALQTIVNEWNEMRTLFKSAAQSEGGFVIDINRSIGDMAAEDFEKSGQDDRDGDKLDEETEKDLMDMLDKLEGPDASSDEDEDDSDDAED